MIPKLHSDFENQPFLNLPSGVTGSATAMDRLQFRPSLEPAPPLPVQRVPGRRKEYDRRLNSSRFSFDISCRCRLRLPRRLRAAECAPRLRRVMTRRVLQTAAKVAEKSQKIVIRSWNAIPFAWFDQPRSVDVGQSLRNRLAPPAYTQMDYSFETESNAEMS